MFELKVLKEITQWSTCTPNHVYFLDDSKTKCYAYIRSGDNTPLSFKKPLAIDIRGRKFVEIANRWKFSVDEVPMGRTWKVAGSKGDTHTVSEENGSLSCTCAGYKFRSQCRHVASIKVD